VIYYQARRLFNISHYTQYCRSNAERRTKVKEKMSSTWVPLLHADQRFAAGEILAKEFETLQYNFLHHFDFSSV